MSEAFVKDDAGKLRFDLLDPVFVEGIVAVLTLGAAKYAPDNWKKGTRERYVAALGRHWNAYLKGEALDAETNKPHLYHAACCLMFLDWMDRQQPVAARLDSEIALEMLAEARSSAVPRFIDDRGGWHPEMTILGPK